MCTGTAFGVRDGSLPATCLPEDMGDPVCECLLHSTAHPVIVDYNLRNTFYGSLHAQASARLAARPPRDRSPANTHTTTHMIVRKAQGALVVLASYGI